MLVNGDDDGGDGDDEGDGEADQHVGNGEGDSYDGGDDDDETSKKEYAWRWARHATSVGRASPCKRSKARANRERNWAAT